MFSNRTVNPSPNRTSIKEANDHLQLLHERVMELETTTTEQSAELKKKDELMHATLRDVTNLKDNEIHDLSAMMDEFKDRIQKLEQTVKEKEQQIELLTHRCHLADDVASYTAIVEKLLSAMRKMQLKTVKHGTTRPKTRVNRSHSIKFEKKHSVDINYSHDGTNSVDAHSVMPNQSFSDMKIGRSFNINSNFSLSEDEEQNDVL